MAKSNILQSTAYGTMGCEDEKCDVEQNTFVSTPKSSTISKRSLISVVALCLALFGVAVLISANRHTDNSKHDMNFVVKPASRKSQSSRLTDFVETFAPSIYLTFAPTVYFTFAPSEDLSFAPSEDFTLHPTYVPTSKSKKSSLKADINTGISQNPTPSPKTSNPTPTRYLPTSSPVEESRKASVKSDINTGISQNPTPTPRTSNPTPTRYLPTSSPVEESRKSSRKNGATLLDVANSMSAEKTDLSKLSRKLGEAKKSVRKGGDDALTFNPTPTPRTLNPVEELTLHPTFVPTSEELTIMILAKESKSSLRQAKNSH